MAKRDVELIIRAREAASTAIEKVTGALNDLRAGATSADAAYGKVGSAVRQAEAGFNRQNVELAETKARYANLGIQLRAAGQHLQWFKGVSGATIASQKEAQATVRLLGTEYRRLQQAFASAGKHLDVQRGDLRATASTMTALGAAARQASLEYTRFSLALQKQNAVEAASARLQAERTQYMAVKHAPATIDKSLPEAAQLQQHRQHVEKLELAWRRAKTTVRNFAVEMKQTGAVNELLSASMGRAQGRMLSLRRALLQAQADMHKFAGATGQAKQQQVGFASALDRMNAALRRNTNSSRTALSWLQRFRGQLIALVTTYVGVIGIIEGLRRTTNAFLETQGAYNRLLVVTQGNQARAATEMSFARAEARRLGFNVGVLAGEWSKFAVTAQATNFTLEEARFIFKSITEAGRTLKLSSEAVSRTFVAVAQVASKGVFQMEELRQQIGEHIPGAFAIMASAVGVSGATLAKMIEKGEVGAEFLTQFAEELNRRFGSQLPTALQSAQAEIGRFSNEVFEAFRVIAEGGFIEQLTLLLRDLNAAMASDEGRARLASIGETLGFIVRGLGFVLNHMHALTTTVAALLTYKIERFLLGLIIRFYAFVRAAKAARVATRAVQLELFALNGAAVVATRAGISLAAAWAFLITPVGITTALAAVATGLAFWATSASKAAQAGVAYERILSAIQAASVSAADDQIKLNEKLREIPFKDVEELAEVALDAVLERVQELQYELNKLSTASFSLDQAGLTEARLQLQEIVLEMQHVAQGGAGRSIAELREELVKFARSVKDPAFRAWILTIEKMGTETEASMVEWNRMQLVLDAISGDAEKSAAAIKKLTGEIIDQRDPVQKLNESFKAFAETLREIEKLNPQLKAKIEFAESLQEVEDKFTANKKAADVVLKDSLAALSASADLSAPGAAEAYAQQAEELHAQYAGMIDQAQQAREAAIAALRDAKAMRELAAKPFDVDAFVQRLSFIQSGTAPSAKGKRSTAGITAGLSEAQVFNLFDRLKPELAGLADIEKRALISQEEMRKELAAAFVRQQQEALTRAGVAPTMENTFLAQALGPENAIRVILANADELVTNLVSQSTEGAQPGLVGNLAGRTAGSLRAQARVATGSGAPILPGGFTESEAAAEKQGELVQKVTAELQNMIATQGLSTREIFIQNQLLEAQVAVVSEEGKKLAEIAGKAYDIVNAEKIREEEKAKAMEPVNDLLERRAELLEVLAFAQDVGDENAALGAEAAGAQLEHVNEELREAIRQAREMALAMNDPTMVAALDNVANRTSRIGQKALVTAEEMNRGIAQGGAEAFGSFFDKVREGEGVMKSLGEAISQWIEDFLIGIAKAIVQQIIFNAISGGGSGGLGAVFSKGVNAFAQHGGGKPGSGTPRTVSPAWFIGAQRMHRGGLPGLRSNEVASILDRNEEVITRDDPRHVLNGGTSGASPVQFFLTPEMLNMTFRDALERYISNEFAGGQPA